jgi:predicted secreted protein
MKTIHLSPANSGDTFQLNVSEVVQLELDESPTTGYIWHFLSDSGPFIVERDSYQLSGGVGGDSIRELQLRFPSPGVWPVTFFLKREWESEVDQAERFTVSFDIH